MDLESSRRESSGRKKRSPRQKAIINAMETRMVLESDRLYGRLSYLNMIAKIAPLLGILGTVYGFLHAFNYIRSTSAPRAYTLPADFEAALASTWIALLVAIPTKILYIILSNRAKRMTLEVNLLARDLMSRFTDPE